MRKEATISVQGGVVAWRGIVLSGSATKDEDPKATRIWEEIVSDAGREKDPKKLRALAEELEHSLDERDKKMRSKPSRADRKPPRKSA